MAKSTETWETISNDPEKMQRLREYRNAYQREYTRTHKDKCREYQLRTWARVLQSMGYQVIPPEGAADE